MNSPPIVFRWKGLIAHVAKPSRQLISSAINLVDYRINVPVVSGQGMMVASPFLLLTFSALHVSAWRRDVVIRGTTPSAALVQGQRAKGAKRWEN